MPDNLMSAAKLSVIAMVVVFIVLWALILIVRAVQGVVGSAERHSTNGEADSPEAPMRVEVVDIATGPIDQEIEEGPLDDVNPDNADSELVAVITAAIQAYEAASVPSPLPFVTRQVAHVPTEQIDSWLIAGRNRLMESRGSRRHRR
jgi:Na+-transporting methylmalonyl-CoA/oxaloacetate decarboxylase gamma subunit